MDNSKLQKLVDKRAQAMAGGGDDRLTEFFLVFFAELLMHCCAATLDASCMMPSI